MSKKYTSLASILPYSFKKNVPSFQILVNSVNFLWFWHGFQQTEAPCLHFHPGIHQRKITHVCTVLSGKHKRGIPIPVKRDSSSAVWSVNPGKPGLIGERVKPWTFQSKKQERNKLNQ